MKTAFVTGGTGVLGKALIKKLLSNGWAVYALHRTSADISEWPPEVIPIEGDIIDARGMQTCIPKAVDGVFHLAASLSLDSRGDEQQMKINVLGTRLAVEAAIEADAKRFIHTSSISAYGRTSDVISEQSKSQAETSNICYERSKWLAEMEVRKAASKGLECVIINPCAIFGPGYAEGWGSIFRNLSDGKLPVLPSGQIVINHIDDVVDAEILAYEKGVSGENYILPGDHIGLADVLRYGAAKINAKAPTIRAGPILLGCLAHIQTFVSRLSGQEPLLTPALAKLLTHDLHCDARKAMRVLGCEATPWKVCVDDMMNWLAQNKLI